MTPARRVLAAASAAALTLTLAGTQPAHAGTIIPGAGCVTWREMRRLDIGQTYRQVYRVTGATGRTTSTRAGLTIRVYPVCRSSKVVILWFRNGRVTFGSTNYRPGWSA